MTDIKTKKIAISQSNYIPWKGYFDFINSVDEFVLYDDMQYTRRDWRNRNKIKTPEGVQWVTIPVEVKGKYLQKINETRISDKKWSIEHWKTLRHNYTHAPFFKMYKDFFENLYSNSQFELLSLTNRFFLEQICNLLNIKTRLSWSTEYRLEEEKTDRLVSICKQLNATHYFTGPAAKDYIDESKFQSANIELIYFDYAGYSEYHQLFPPFEHAVSIIDLIFNEGPNSSTFMKSFSNYE